MERERGLARSCLVRRCEDAQIAIDESMAEICPSWKVHVACASVLSNIATRLGLPGTIVGLIETFTAVTDADLAGKADLLPAVSRRL